MQAAKKTGREPTKTLTIPGFPTPGKEPLQIRIPAEIKRQFKSQAALRGIEPNELFVELWQQYLKSKDAE